MKKNIYYNILKIIIEDDNFNFLIKNIYEKEIIIKIFNQTHKINTNEILNFNSTSQKFEVQIIVPSNNTTDSFNEDIKIPELNGFEENSLIETIDGPKKIKEINSGDMILNKYGKKSKVNKVYLFKINENHQYYPIKISKSKCGLNLPYEDLICSIKAILKIKKVTLKARNLLMNRKAQIYKYNQSFYYYTLETEDNEDYLINGFITTSV